MIDKPHKLITQGSIFSNAIASDFKDDVFGLVITARCDFAHDKISVVNYVPIIPFGEWITSYAYKIAIDRTLKEEMGKARGALERLNETPSLLELFELDEILATLKPHFTERKFSSDFSSLEKAIECLKYTKSVSESDAFDVNFFGANKKLFTRIISDLCQNQIADMHYFERIRYQGESRPHVALLREVRFIDFRLAKEISNGLDYHAYNQILKLYGCAENSLNMKGEDCFCENVGTVRSPDIEFIMQRITTLFARIGVQDVPKVSILKLAEYASEKVML